MRWDNDWLWVGILAVWPVMLVAGFVVLALGSPIAWIAPFFFMYCLFSAPGMYKLAKSYWDHGIHYDR